MNKSTSSLDKKRFEVEIYTNHKWVKKIFIIEDDRVTLCSKILIKKDLNNSRIDDIPLQEMFQKVLKNPNKSNVISITNNKSKQSLLVSFKTEVALQGWIDKTYKSIRDNRKKQINKTPEGKSIYKEYRPLYKKNKQNITRSCDISDSKDTFILNKVQTPQSNKTKKLFMNINNLNMSHFNNFEEQLNRIDSTKFVGSDMNNYEGKLMDLLRDIEDFKHYAFDSHMLNSLMKSFNLKKKDLV